MSHSVDSLLSPRAPHHQVVVHGVSVSPLGARHQSPVITRRYATVFQSIVPTLLVALLLVTSIGLFSITRTQRLFTVISGSMSPAIPTGAIIGIEPVAAEALATGNVIAFRASAGIITHRIVERIATSDGLFFATKGDANPIVDPQLVAGGQVLGRQTFAVPYAGYVVAALRTRLGFAFGILLPATLVVLHELRTVLTTWRTMPRVRRLRPSLAWGGALAIALLTTAPLAYALLNTNTVSGLATISAAAAFPTPTLSPTPSSTPNSSPTPSPTLSPSATPTVSPGPCDLSVTTHFQNVNTGPGSTNTNSLDVEHTCVVTETNQTTTTNTVDVTANTGNNSAAGNTNDGSISTGAISVSIANTP